LWQSHCGKAAERSMEARVVIWGTIYLGDSCELAVEGRTWGAW